MTLDDEPGSATSPGAAPRRTSMTTIHLTRFTILSSRLPDGPPAGSGPAGPCPSSRNDGRQVGSASREIEKLAEPCFVKAHDGSTVYHCDRRRHEAHSLQLTESRRILADIPFLKGDSMLRKKLFRLLAEQSAGL